MSLFEDNLKKGGFNSPAYDTYDESGKMIVKDAAMQLEIIMFIVHMFTKHGIKTLL